MERDIVIRASLSKMSFEVGLADLTTAAPEAAIEMTTEEPVQAKYTIPPNVTNIKSDVRDLQQYWDWNFANRQVPKHIINCKAVLEDEEEEIQRVKKFMTNHQRNIIQDKNFFNLTKDCIRFKTERGYVRRSLSNEEEEFPIAFSILLYKDLQQVERLLRAIYRPNNIYCLHVDGYSSDELYLATQSLANCFKNVFLTTKREKIVYAGYSRLQAEINCMSDALVKDSKWKYYINLASEVFPLKTNLEMVKILKVYNGANDIEGITGNRLGRIRFMYEYAPKPGPMGRPMLFQGQHTNITKPPPPHNIQIVRGSAYGIFSRGFVDYIVHNQIAIDLRKWGNGSYSPDEHYWATLHHLQINPHLHTPGGYDGEPMKKPWLAVYASWGGQDPCYRYNRVLVYNFKTFRSLSSGQSRIS